MLIFHEQIFDELIEGTGQVYTTEDFNPSFGRASTRVLLAVATNVGASGGNVTLSGHFEESADNLHWDTGAGLTLTGTSTWPGLADIVAIGKPDLAPPPLPFGRLRLVLAGSLPSCRLKVYLTGRQY